MAAAPKKSSPDADETKGLLDLEALVESVFDGKKKISNVVDLKELKKSRLITEADLMMYSAGQITQFEFTILTVVAACARKCEYLRTDPRNPEEPLRMFTYAEHIKEGRWKPFLSHIISLQSQRLVFEKIESAAIVVVKYYRLNLDSNTYGTTTSSAIMYKTKESNTAFHATSESFRIQGLDSSSLLRTVTDICDPEAFAKTPEETEATRDFMESTLEPDPNNLWKTIAGTLQAMSSREKKKWFDPSSTRSENYTNLADITASAVAVSPDMKEEVLNVPLAFIQSITIIPKAAIKPQKSEEIRARLRKELFFKSRHDFCPVVIMKRVTKDISSLQRLFQTLFGAAGEDTEPQAVVHETYVLQSCSFEDAERLAVRCTYRSTDLPATEVTLSTEQLHELQTTGETGNFWVNDDPNGVDEYSLPSENKICMFATPPDGTRIRPLIGISTSVADQMADSPNPYIRNFFDQNNASMLKEIVEAFFQIAPKMFVNAESIFSDAGKKALLLQRKSLTGPLPMLQTLPNYSKGDLTEDARITRETKKITMFKEWATAHKINLQTDLGRFFATPKGDIDEDDMEAIVNFFQFSAPNEPVVATHSFKNWAPVFFTITSAQLAAPPWPYSSQGFILNTPQAIRTFPYSSIVINPLFFYLDPVSNGLVVTPAEIAATEIEVTVGIDVLPETEVCEFAVKALELIINESDDISLKSLDLAKGIWLGKYSDSKRETPQTRIKALHFNVKSKIRAELQDVLKDLNISSTERTPYLSVALGVAVRRGESTP